MNELKKMKIYGKSGNFFFLPKERATSNLLIWKLKGQFYWLKPGTLPTTEKGQHAQLCQSARHNSFPFNAGTVTGTLPVHDQFGDVDKCPFKKARSQGHFHLSLSGT